MDDAREQRNLLSKAVPTRRWQEAVGEGMRIRALTPIPSARRHGVPTAFSGIIHVYISYHLYNQ